MPPTDRVNYWSCENGHIVPGYYESLGAVKDCNVAGCGGARTAYELEDTELAAIDEAHRSLSAMGAVYVAGELEMKVLIPRIKAHHAQPLSDTEAIQSPPLRRRGH